MWARRLGGWIFARSIRCKVVGPARLLRSKRALISAHVTSSCHGCEVREKACVCSACEQWRLD